MRLILIACFSLFLTTGFGQTKNLVTERILHTVRFDDSSGKDKGHYQHADENEKNHLINEICSLVFYGKLNAHYCSNAAENNLGGLISGVAKEICFSIDNNLNDTDNAQSQYIKFYSPIRREDCIYRNLVNIFGFKEKWTFNEKKNRFEKIVSGIYILGDNPGREYDYFIELNDSIATKYDINAIAIKNIIYDVPITTTSYKNFNDLNWWYNYLETSKREKLITTFIKKANHDTGKSPLNNYKPSFPFDTIIDKRSIEFDNIYSGRSNKFGLVSDPEMSGVSFDDFLECCYELDDWRTVRKLRFHENWYFDSEELRFEKKVLGIGMIVDKYNEEGQVIGDTCLVYYKMNP